MRERHAVAGAVQPGLEIWPLEATVGVQLEQEGVEAQQRAHQQQATIAIFSISGVDNGLHQRTLGVDQEVPLIAPDFLASVVARRVDAGSPFSF